MSWKPSEKSISESVSNEWWQMLLGEVRQKLRLEEIHRSGGVDADCSVARRK